MKNVKCVCFFLLGKHAVFPVGIESQNRLGCKTPQRSSSPTVNLPLPSPPTTVFPSNELDNQKDFLFKSYSQQSTFISLNLSQFYVQGH